MSPWISEEFMDLLLSKKLAGVDVRVMTTNDFNPEQKKALSKLIESQVRILKPENKTVKFLGLGLLIAGIALAPLTVGVTLIVSFIGLVMFLIGKEKTEVYWISKLGENNLKVYVSSMYHINHAKIYIADSVAILGSANFTGAGTKRNFESMISVKSDELVAEICKQMDELPHLLNLKEASYDSIAESIRRTESNRRYHYWNE